MQRSSVVSRSIAVLVILLAAQTAVAQGDAAGVQQLLLDALSRGDVPTALSLFTENAVVDVESGLCVGAPCVGKAAIKSDLERIAADKSRHVTPLNTYVAGPLLITRFEASSATIRSAGVDRIILWGIREMEGTKIASIRCCLPERTDPQTARFIDWDYAHPSTR